MTAILDARARSLEDVKDSQEIVENKDHELEETATLDLVSNYADLPRGQAMRKFWRLFLIGVMVASAGM